MTTTKIIVRICSNYDTTDDYDGWSLMMMMMMTMMMIMMMMMMMMIKTMMTGEANPSGRTDSKHVETESRQ